MKTPPDRQGATPYFWFQKEHKERVAKEFPGESIPELNNRLKALWQTTNPSQRKPFLEKAAEAQKRRDRLAAEKKLSKQTKLKQTMRAKGRKRAAPKTDDAKEDTSTDESDSEAVELLFSAPKKKKKRKNSFTY